MARRAVRLLLAVVLAAVLFHKDAAALGWKKEAPARPPEAEGVVLYDHNHKCGACQVMTQRVNVAEALSSAVSKVPAAISEITGIAENACKQVAVADDYFQAEERVIQLRVFQDEEQRCNAECTSTIESAWLEVMKQNNDIVEHIYKKQRSFQQLLEFVCNKSRRSAEGDDDGNENKFETTVKKLGRFMKELVPEILKLLQKEKSTDLAKACENLNAFLK